MATQVLPPDVMDLLWKMNIDTHSVLWNLNTSGQHVSLNLSWTIAENPSTINAYSRNTSRTTWERPKKSPSTLRRDKERREKYAQQKNWRPASSTGVCGTGQDTGAQAQVSVNTAMPDNCDKVSVSAQTNYLVTAPKSVQTTTDTCETANQTVNLSTSHSETQTEQTEQQKEESKRRPYISHGRADCVLGYQGQGFDKQALIR
jgi:hypothetical protein